ncbi:MAG: glycosyltransferase family 4 protein [Candidatus Woesearchaeota archaeon]
MKKKKKLLIATDNFLPRWDGVARFLTEIIPTLSKKYEITVLAPNFGPLIYDGYKLVRIEQSRFGLGDYTAPKLAFKTIRREIKKNDIIFTQTIGPIGLSTIIFAKQKNKKIATYLHSLEWELVPMSTNNLILRKFLYPLTKIITKYAYNKSDLIITPSNFIADALTWRGIHTKKTVATLGVDCDVFKPAFERSKEELEEIDAIKQELNLQNSYVIGNHGRLANEKDLITILRAFNRIKKRHKNAKLLIIGDGVESIKQKFQKTKDCILISAKNNVQIYLNLIDIYVTSSLTETTSLTTLEAMASGLPVISTPVGFIKEYIKHKQNGLFFKQKDSYDLYKKINILKNDSKLSLRLGLNARKLIVREFKWENTAKKIDESLSSLH